MKISTCCPCFILLYLRSSIDLRSDLLYLTSGPCNGSTGLGVSSFLYVSWFKFKCLGHWVLFSQALIVVGGSNWGGAGSVWGG